MKCFLSDTRSLNRQSIGHHRSAGHFYLRAATYRRAALHRHPDPYHAEVPIQSQLAVDAFEKFLVEFEYPCKPVKIPYEDTTLPGYLCINPNVQGPAPTIIFQEGKDGWAEDGKFVVDESLPRGYHVLLFDGPGIGKVMRLQGLPFRHDWENVSTCTFFFSISYMANRLKSKHISKFHLGHYSNRRLSF